LVRQFLQHLQGSEVVSHHDNREKESAYFAQKILSLLVHFALSNHKLIFHNLVPHILGVI
jgi:hypothetical protein